MVVDALFRRNGDMDETSLSTSVTFMLELVSLNLIVWCYVCYYVWLNVVINKVSLLLSKNNGNMNIWTLSYNSRDV